MYVDAEFCQRKWADIQLDCHNKGLGEEFALDVCANANRESRPVEAAAVNIKSLLTLSLSNPSRSETGCEQQQRLLLCGPGGYPTNPGADSRRLQTKKINEQKVYLNPLNQILHDYFFLFFSLTGILIFPNLLCAHQHWLNVTLKASSSDLWSPIFNREVHKSRARQDLWRMFNRHVQPVIHWRPEATCCAIPFKRSCAVSWQESTVHRRF